jgi:hypothetical protein
METRNNFKNPTTLFCRSALAAMLVAFAIWPKSSAWLPLSVYLLLLLSPCFKLGTAPCHKNHKNACFIIILRLGTPSNNPRVARLPKTRFQAEKNENVAVAKRKGE